MGGKFEWLPSDKNGILGGLAGRDLFFVRGPTTLLSVPGTFNRNCLSSGTGPPNNFNSWTAARSLSRAVGFERPRRSANHPQNNQISLDSESSLDQFFSFSGTEN